MMNPIIRKEVLFSLRSSKAMVLQILFLTAIAILLWLLWPAEGLQDIEGQQARKLLMIISIGELALVVLVAPTFTSTSITLERERNTLESLLATPMSALKIVFGKITGALTFLILVVLTGIPALFSLMLLGGVDPKEILAVVAILLVSAVYLGMIGLMVSVLMHRSYRAIIMTYFVLLLVVFVFAIPTWPVSGKLIHRAGPIGAGIMHVLASFSPLEAMLSLLVPDGPYTTGAKGWPAFWQMYLLITIGITMITTLMLMFTLHRALIPAKPREGLKVVERGQITGRTVLYLFFFDPRKRKRHIGWWQNPVLIKECRTRRTLQLHWLARATAIALMISIALMVLVSISVSALAAESISTISAMTDAIGILMVVLLILAGPALTSGAISSDRESGVWDLLRITPLPAWRIVSGKLQACFIPLLLMIIGCSPALIILVYFQKGLLPNIIRVMAVVGITSVFVTAAGMFFSSMFSKTSVATAWTYGVVLAMSMVTLLALLGKGIFGPRFMEIAFMINPITAVMDAAGDRYMSNYNLFQPYLYIISTAIVVFFILSVIRVFQLCRADK